MLIGYNSMPSVLNIAPILYYVYGNCFLPALRCTRGG